MWLITQNLKPGKGYVIEKLSSPFNKENGNIVISKDDCGKLSWDHKHVLVLDFLDHGLTLPNDCCCGTLSLWQSFFANGFGYFAKLLSLCMKMPVVTHPTGQLFMAVHLIGYGSVPILCSVLYLSLHPWKVPDWQVIAIDADVKQVVTSWLQTLDNNVFTLEYNHCGANTKMVVVTTLRSDVYHPLHVCHVLIKATITF